VGTIQLGAHVNNALNGRSDNVGVKTGILDSAGDQKAIRAGYFYPNGKPPSLIYNSLKNPGAFTPWNKF